MITVRTLLLSQARFNYAIFAGARGLDKEIKTISFIDAPCVSNMLLGGEFILTTAFLYGNSPEALYDFIETLIEAGSAALGIKMGPYVQEIPESIIKLANANDFPIVSIPSSVVWSDIITLFHDLRTNSINNESLLTNDVAKFERAVKLGDWSLEKIRNEFVGMISIATSIVDEKYKVLANNELEGSEEILTYLGYILNGEISGHSAYLEQTRKVGKYWIAELILNHKERLLLASRNRMLSRNVMQLLQTLYSMSCQQTDDIEECQSAKFIEGAISDNCSFSLREMSEKLGIAQARQFVVLLINGKNYHEAFYKFKNAVQKKETFMEWKVYSHSKEEEQELIVLCCILAKDLSGIDIITKLRYICGNYLFNDMECSLYFGNTVDSVRNINESYKKARTVQKVGNILWPNNKVIFMQDIDVITIPEYDSVSLDEISLLQKKINTFDACKTLEAYLESDSIKAAADKVFIHENTLRYRLAKLSEILQIDLTNPMNKLNLLIKIKLNALYNSM